MDPGLIAQYVANSLMLGIIYAMVAVGFTLFFGVLDVIKFSHGDVLTVGAYTGLATFLGLELAGVAAPWAQLALVALAAMAATAVLGALIGKYFVLPLRGAPALNTLLITLMLGTVLREAIHLFYPQGSIPSDSRGCCRRTPWSWAPSRCGSTIRFCSPSASPPSCWCTC
jgi:branched-chain amino acid transport system permease protein